MADPQLTYRAALDELRSIHGRLRSEDVDVDRLLEDVQRASELLAFCRERLESVGERLEEVLEASTVTGRTERRGQVRPLRPRPPRRPAPQFLHRMTGGAPGDVAGLFVTRWASHRSALPIRTETRNPNAPSWVRGLGLYRRSPTGPHPG